MIRYNQATKTIEVVENFGWTDTVLKMLKCIVSKVIEANEQYEASDLKNILDDEAQYTEQWAHDTMKYVMGYMTEEENDSVFAAPNFEHAIFKGLCDYVAENYEIDEDDLPDEQEVLDEYLAI